MDRVYLFGFLWLVSTVALPDSVASVDASGFVPFNRLDSDNNGYVSRVEARIAMRIRELFDAADANRDGLLDRDEYPAARAAIEVR